MKKNREHKPVLHKDRWWKICTIMKLTLLMSVFLVFTALGNGYSQEKVSMQLGSTTIKKALTEFQRLTNKIVIYSDDDFVVHRKVKADFDEVELEDFLKSILRGSDMTYRMMDDYILILPARKNPMDSVRTKSVRLKGWVYDVKKQPMPGVTVKVAGISMGTATNEKGWFALELPLQRGSLEFSFIGYKKETITFTEKIARDTLRVTLTEDVQTLDETVVVAYGTTTRRETTGAISVVKAEELRGIPSPSIANLLQGRVAGMDVTNMSGAPGGGGTAITIRGYNSLDVEQGRRFSNPLWVVDGVPLNTFTSPVTGTNMLAEINPDMIESVQILKDASSAAIYGSRAANGVILITTKKGRKNQNATFSANISQSWNILPELPTVTTGRGERDFRLKALKKHYAAYLDMETLRYKYPTSLEESYLHDKSSLDYFFTGTPSTADGLTLQDSLNSFYNNSTNYFPMYFVKAKITNANIQTYGGSDRMNYGIGLGYYDESGILKGTGFTRIDLNSTMNVTPVQRLNVDLRLNASLTNRKRGQPSEYFNSSESTETVPGDPYKLSTLYPGKGSEVWDNVLEQLRGTKEKNRSVRLRANFKLGYDIIDGLNISTSLAADYSVHRRNYFSPSYLNSNGYSSSVGETAINLMVLNENLLSYQKTIKEYHNISFVAGFSYQYDQMEYNGGSAENSPSDKIYYAPQGMPDVGEEEYWGTKRAIAFQHYQSDMQEKVLLSYFARLEYNYMKKYLLSASFRRDGSSVFGKNNKWGTFPSIAAGWTFTEESFMQPHASWFNFGKFRASWGKSGMHFDQAYLALGLMNVGDIVYQGNGILIPNYYDGLYNEDLSWEETDQYDFGLDLDFLNYRLGVTFDYYYRYTDKMLMRVPLPGDYNGYMTQWRNAAAVSNEGVELLIKYEIFRKPDLYWKVSVNGARNWNRFEKSYDGRDVMDSQTNWIIGKSLNGIYARKTNGFVHYQDELPVYYNAAGISSYLAQWSRNFYKPGDYKFVDVNSDGQIMNDVAYCGSALPIVSGGIVSEFRWKNIDLNLSMSYQLGRHMINLTRANSFATDASNNLEHPLLVDIRGITFWEKPGDYADYPMLQFDTMVGNFDGEVDRNVEKVNWLKLKTLTVGYCLPEKWIKKSGMQEVRFFVSGENLLTFTNYSGIDPEIVNINTGIDQGRNYPLARKYTLGLTVKF